MWITVPEFAEKYNVSSRNILEAVHCGRLPSYVLDMSCKPYLINEDCIVKEKGILNSIRRDTQLNFKFLNEHLINAAIVRLCILAGADITVEYGREFFKSKLWVYKQTSILAHQPTEKLLECYRATEWLVDVVRFLGTFDEREISDYISEIRGLKPTVVHVKKKKLYKNVCTECGSVRFLDRQTRSKDGVCRDCAILKVHKKNIKDEDSLKRWWYFCPGCSSVRLVIAKRKTSYCRECLITGKKRDSFVMFNLDGSKIDMRHFRICPECPEDNNASEVASAKNSGIKLCRKHSYASQNKMKQSGYKKPRKAKYSPVGVDGAKRNKVTVKFQIVDPETMEAPVKKRKEKPIPKTPREIELQMQEEWLKKNQPTVT